MMMHMMSNEENVLNQAVAQAIQPVVHLEKEWDRDKFHKKMLEYMNKAAKGASYGGSWEKSAADFCMKFYESYWRALGDRYAYVEKIDFGFALGAAMEYHFPKNVTATIPSKDEFLQKVYVASETGFDTCRWGSWGYQVVKTVVSGKTSQKKASEAVDYAREQTVASMVSDNESFIASWIQGTVGKLSAITAGGFQDVLPKAMAVRLFNELIQDGGGLPRTLEQANGKPPAGWPEIEKAVGEAYGNPVAALEGMKTAAAPGMGAMGAMGYGAGAMGSPMGYGSGAMGSQGMGFNAGGPNAAAMAAMGAWGCGPNGMAAMGGGDAWAQPGMGGMNPSWGPCGQQGYSPY